MDLSVWRSVFSLPRALVFGITALVSSAALAATAYAGVVTTASVIKTAKAAITEQLGTHVVSTASSGSSTTEKVVADVGATSGSETISVGKEDVSVRVTPA